ncbi:MAG: hypothetical protein HYS09_02325 [Chloroflexi bacterium]|nr:hypothetical protein [Chloroflexota bacterium]
MALLAAATQALAPVMSLALTPSDGGPLTLLPVAINTSAGDQFDPHVSGDLASYTAYDKIRFYNFFTGSDDQIPSADAADVLSDVSGGKIVFSRFAGGAARIMVYDTALSTTTEVDPQPAPFRGMAAIGSNTVAFIDFSVATGELFASELGGATQQVTNDSRYDRSPNVAPLGDLIVYESCESDPSNCDIRQAAWSGASWVVISLTNNSESEANPDSDGVVVVYDAARSGEQDIYWQSVGGSAENVLTLAGAQRNPSVSAGVVAFESVAVGDTAADLFVYQISSNRLFRVTNTPVDETLNDVYVFPDGRVRMVWSSGPDGDRDVYGLTFELPAVDSDNDGDGVLDADDLCPDTPTGEDVDANGCSDSQVDSDGDGVCDPDAPSAGPSGCVGADACPTTPGLVDRQGCPVGDLNKVTLHIVDQAKSGACPGGAGSCKSPIAGAQVRVFDRNDGDFQTAYGGKNPSGSLYGTIFEAGTGQIASCTTDASGQCTAGEEGTGDYLVIVKTTVDSKTVYTGKPKSGTDFVDTNGDTLGDLASKDFQVIKVIKRDGTVQIGGGSKTVVTGSYLEVISPDFAIWEDVAAGYVYPFIFTSDSDWSVNLCAQVPTGYDIVGVYDENGDLLADSSCAQTFVSGETKVVAYEVVEVGSPEPVLGALLTVEHEGKVTEVDVEVPGQRTYVERPQARPAALPNTGATDATDSDGGLPAAWLALPAGLGGALLLGGGFLRWRRRRG